MNRREMLKAIGVSAVGAYGLSVLGGAGNLLAAPDAPGAPAGAETFAAGLYKLSPLPYAADGLEPHIDKETVSLHHDKHHAAYVAGLNATLAKLAAAREKGDFQAIRASARDLAFNGSGHVLHSIYWTNMTPGGRAADANSELLKAINGQFTSLAKLKDELTAAAVNVEASGWAILAYEPIARELRVLQAERHEDLTQWGAVPLLAVDVWEHAYYLKYQNRRADYVAAFWQVANWDNVAGRFDAARKLAI